MAALADSSKRWHIVLRCTICGPLGLLFTSPLKPLNEILIQLNLTGSKISMSFYQVCVFRADRKNNLGRSEKQDGHPGLWLAETFSTFSLKSLNGIQRNLTGSNVLYQVCVLGQIGKKQDGRHGLWLAETFSTFLKPLDGIQRNLIRSKIWTSSTKFVCFGQIGKSDFLWFAETFSTSLQPVVDPSKRWHIVRRCTLCGPLGPLFCFLILFFGLIRPRKVTNPPSDWPSHFDYSSAISTELLSFLQNLAGRKYSKSSTKFVLSWPIRKLRWQS